jgi:redox-sensitive bicupin YhaK (pirin superfamily)
MDMIDLIIEARKADIGALAVSRLLPFRQRRMVGPFIFLDHIPRTHLLPDVPRSMDVRPHPHIGLSTVSYLFDGVLMHRDSTGAEQLIRPGEVNWMTAGSGISHSERFEGSFRQTGGPLEFVQTWVALPEEAEEANPRFDHYDESVLPVFEEKGAWGRLIAGSAYGINSGVPTLSPLFYLHVELQVNAAVQLPAGYPERAVYVVRGSIDLGGHAYQAGQMIVFAASADPVLTAREPTTLMMLGGEPVGPRHIWWNFVSSSQERIAQAKSDWQSGRIALPIHDDREFIPLPAE